MTETSGLILLAVLATAALLFWPQQISFLTEWLPRYIILMGLLVTTVGLIYYLLTQIEYRSFSIVLFFYACYFIGMGLICQILSVTMGFESLPFLLMTAIYASSWLIGYLMPGAPGGIGVREMVFILIGSPIIEQHHALVLIAAVRLISITAEVLLYFIGPKLSLQLNRLSAWSDKKAL